MHSLATLIENTCTPIKDIHTNHVPEVQCMKTYRYRSGASSNVQHQAIEWGENR